MAEKVVIVSRLSVAWPRPAAFASSSWVRFRARERLPPSSDHVTLTRRVTPSPNLAHSSMGQTAGLSVTGTT